MAMTPASILPPLLMRHMELFICPACSGNLTIAEDRQRIECSTCNHSFTVENGMPHLFWPHAQEPRGDVTEAIKSFYEANPFPNYEDVDSATTLREKAEKGIFARLLDDQIPHGAMVLEVGCGTGQLSNFLGLRWGRTVFATDFSLRSLKLGQEFKERNQIDNVAFLQMNLLVPTFKEESFDFVICNGVLHHTSNPFLSFQSISRLVKKGGFIIIGLYNRYGRIPTDILRFIFRVFGERLAFLDPRLRTKNLSSLRKRTWFMDQYKNPHESKHTIGEVLTWFDRCGFDFINGIPKCTPFDSFSPQERLFKLNPRGGGATTSLFR